VPSLPRPRAATCAPTATFASAATRPTTAVLVLACAVLVVACLACFAVWRVAGPGSGRAGRAPGAATVVRVVDGDTVVVELGGSEETVRLIGIDTPETVAPDQPEECFGAEASAHLAALLPPGSAVRLTRDVEPRDAYDRLLAYVEAGGEGRLVNLSLVAEGYAVAKHYPPNTAHRDDLEAAERAARAGRFGLWSACGGADVALTPARAP
jgi:endonuclease YncB( thermonuclease family)